MYPFQVGGGERVVCADFVLAIFETQKAVGLIALPFWMAALVPRDHLCRTQWEP